MLMIRANDIDDKITDDIDDQSNHVMRIRLESVLQKQVPAAVFKVDVPMFQAL